MNLWFTEELPIQPGMRAQIEISKVIHSEKSKFQKLDVLETTRFGRMLLLDDVIMCTEFDETGYHEMICHVPAFAHKNPERILVIGGGDGGTVREAVKHPSVKEVHLCEIDERVVEVCKEFMPSFSSAFGNPKVKCHFEDGARWAAEHKNEYDIIIVDSSDPIGPAEVLFQLPFYEACAGALREDGIMVSQAENFLMHTKIIRELLSFGKKLFPVYRYYFTQVPTYPGGMIGFTFFSKKYSPEQNYKEKLQKSGYEFVSKLKYWNEELHLASFVLPSDAKHALFD